MTAGYTPPQKPFNWKHILLHLVLILGSLVMLLPFFWMLSTSLKEPREIFTYPPTWIPNTFAWHNYQDALTAMPFDRFYFNSLFVATSVTIIQVLTSSLAAFAFARLRFKGRDTIFLIYLAALMIPFPVLLIPNFIITVNLDWYNTYWALIIPPAFSAFSTFLMRQHFRSLPMDLDEAARMDGASTFRIWWSIIMPMSKTAIAAVSIFVFLGTWNDFLWPLVVTNSEEMRTIPVGLNSFQGQYSVRWNLLMAAAVVAMLPVLIVYAFAQKWFIQGIAMTGMNGR
ncbi:carbohydrate ABC transporter permease [Phototrophicus methaneseepsis]|uniref:Carbohydrate ABC transporter permease n=1 Tax=Phototrophicus methaneseepsis TaxID=2710758 RepID=A0A7S8EDH7_9CHLR|nr:carbohydrate ABC transporter permease [Phototrophicus methaneseepsis]QPC84947.1 carbohydrate ABC transporter permease [Phototrophicus methaneseepsis]